VVGVLELRELNGIIRLSAPKTALKMVWMKLLIMSHILHKRVLSQDVHCDAEQLIQMPKLDEEELRAKPHKHPNSTNSTNSSTSSALLALIIREQCLVCLLNSMILLYVLLLMERWTWTTGLTCLETVARRTTRAC